jgi:hypothetical protein
MRKKRYIRDMFFYITSFLFLLAIYSETWHSQLNLMVNNEKISQFYFEYFVYLEYLFKFLIIGSASTGKSCILHRFLENSCTWLIFYCANELCIIVVRNESTHTIGAEFGSKVLTVGSKNVKLQIWDVCSVWFSSIFEWFASI